MNKIIRNALVYKADLPSAQLLENHLKDNPFIELGPIDASRAGFVPVPQGYEYVERFEGGLAFAVRIDEKILPASVVKQEVAKRCKVIKETRDYIPGRKERKEIEEIVIQELLAKALVRSKTITCYYDTANRFLIIPVSSKTIAAMITGKLVKAVGSVKTETINISDVKMGLTTRLTSWVQCNEEAFGENFNLGDVVQLQRITEKKEKISFDLKILDSAREGLSEALSAGFYVTSLGMMHGSVAFRLTSDFHFKDVAFGYETEDPENAYEGWLQDAAVQVLEFSRVVTSLCDLMGYKAPESEEAAA